MFRRILVPVDLTPKNRRAVEVARNLASGRGSEVMLLHVIETLDLPFDELREFYDRLQTRATETMSPLIGTLEGAGVAASGHILYGPREARIVRFARHENVDLIVMDSHRVSGEPGRGIATLSYRVAVMASCPVLLVKGTDGDGGAEEEPGRKEGAS